ncbi:VOC family protein [Mucilaginibacter roseus]|uniref:VOC family protein n=1 Tax=Mucilaginibacter roseus TaxID=1528868 RepID=A0ABS8TZX0_9SPHI|nr:VOC family protein [Mucilaginibacter roseus]MCD8740404.1 VOC family protein [Mucilaginibacter roseus]
MQKIAPFLWFDNNAEEAMNYYLSVFKDSKPISIMRATEGMPGAPGSVLVAYFELNGVEFAAMNGGPQFKFDEAISFVINCEDQEEVDYYWNTFIGDGGTESACGWLKDKFGVSWQVTPTRLIELMQDKDPVKAQRVAQAMMGMIKIDIAELEKAYAG